jgi:hypothetical protein
MQPLPKAQQCIGQYSTLQRAQQEARKLTKEAGRYHRAVQTVTWRNLVPMQCWTVCL